VVVCGVFFGLSSRWIRCLPRCCLSFAKTGNAPEEFDFRQHFLAGHKQIALENAALRQQLAILKREQPRPKLHYRDRLFWIFLMKIWKQWRTALIIVRPATVVSCEVKSRDGIIVAPGNVGDTELEESSDHFIAIPSTNPTTRERAFSRI
jgi:hypothetical protein